MITKLPNSIVSSRIGKFMRISIIIILVLLSFAIQAHALVLCTNTKAAVPLLPQEACNDKEVMIDPADIGLDGNLVLYDSHGAQVGTVQGFGGWGTTDNQALVAFEAKGQIFFAVFARSTSDHALGLCLSKNRFCWKYDALPNKP